MRRAVATIMAGEEVGDIFRGGRAFDVQVWSTPETRDSVDDIERLLIDTPSGEQVSCPRSPTSTSHRPTTAIERENQSRRLDVSANVGGRDLGSIARDVEQIVDGVDLPLGFSAEIIGEYKERQETQSTLFKFSVSRGAIVFLLLLAAFASWRLALLAFVCLPSALVGRPHRGLADRGHHLARVTGRAS